MREFDRGRSWFLAAACLILRLVSGAPDASAQIAPRLGLGGTVEAGGEAERYLRVLQLTGQVVPAGWSTLPFASSVEHTLAVGTPNPWQSRLSATDTASGLKWLRPLVLGAVNTTFPFQQAVGPVWQGRGGTAAFQAGVHADWNWLRVQLAPIAFTAQNAIFALANNTLSGDSALADARFPVNIDHPQRFGRGTYARVD